MNMYISAQPESAPALPDISRKLFNRIISASFVVALLLHVALYFGGLFAISADESGRALDALAWSETFEIRVDAWLPFYQVVMGIAVKGIGDLFFAPRIVSFIFGCITHGALIALAYQLFRRRDVAAMTAAISTVIHHRAIFGVVPLAEIMYFAAIISSMAFLAHRLHTGRTSSTLWCAVCLAVGTSIRYEAWFFGLVLAACIIIAGFREWNGVRLRPAEALALPILAVFPLWWLLQQYLHTGHPIGFLLHSPDRFAPMHNASMLRAIWHNSALQFVVQNIATCMLIGILPAIAMWRTHRQMRLWLIVPLGALVLLSLVLLGGKGLTTHNPWRIASGWSLLLVPFAAYWLVSLARAQQGAIWQRWSMPAIIVALCLLQTVMYARMTSTFSMDDGRMGTYLGIPHPKIHKLKNDILVETSDWAYLNVAIASNEVQRFVYNAGADPLFPQDTILRPGRPVDIARLHERKIQFLLFKSPEYTYAIEQDTTIKLERQQGEWKLYAVPAKTGSE